MARVWTPKALESPHQTPDKARRVRRMFDTIAPRYELVNTVCSAGRDAYWRRRAVELARVTAVDEVLDVGCGTGDFARAFAAAGPRLVVGCDFAHAMLLQATAATAPGGNGSAEEQACRREPGPALTWCEGDALHLPFRSESFTIASCAFGVRNFQDLDRGLGEMYRVLRPGGRAVILEFTRPANRLLRVVYEFYAGRVMPVTATWLSGDRSGAYRYLPKSVVSFVSSSEMRRKLESVGFTCNAVKPLTFGVVTVYVAARA